MELTQQEKEAIEGEVKVLYPGRTERAGMNGVVRRQERKAYITGATAYALKAKYLENALHKIAYKIGMTYEEAEGIAKQALSDYK